MTEWGGTDAESLKSAIDNIFADDKGKYPLHNYGTKLVSLTTDGASVTRIIYLVSWHEWLLNEIG